MRPVLSPVRALRVVEPAHARAGVAERDVPQPERLARLEVEDEVPPRHGQAGTTGLERSPFGLQMRPYPR